MLLRMWLHNRAPNTASAYRNDVQGLLAHAGKPLAQIVLADLQAWDTAATALSAATRARRIAAVRSLFRFALEVGLLTVDPCRGLKVPKPAAAGTEKIITAANVRRLIAAETAPLRHAALGLLYLCGLRASEVCALNWRDLTPGRKGAAEAKILGKGSKPRTVTVPAPLWRELMALNPAMPPGAPVIAEPGGRRRDRRWLHRIVVRASRRVGLASVSPHWLRHSHASHALDNGAPPQVVQQNLGHASLGTTTRYAHARRGDSSADYLDEVL
jgi:integrase/recombinase XerD